MSTPTIGLFGTCDGNRWRDAFMEAYEVRDIPYFNPMVDNWHPGLVADEARHLAEDEIVLFPVLGWSYAEASLSELGFGPLRAMRQNSLRSFVILIEMELHERLTDPDRRKASLRSRKLVAGHFTEVAAPNVYMVKNLDEMLNVSIELHAVHTRLKNLHQSLARVG